MTTTEITSRGVPKGRDALATTIRRAVTNASRQGRSQFVYAGHGGYRIGTDAPTVGRFYRFDADGSMFLVEA